MYSPYCEQSTACAIPAATAAAAAANNNNINRPYNIGMPHTGKRTLVCAQLHFNICNETGVQLDKKHWYEHVPKSVETGQGGNVTTLWNQQVQTDRTIPNNKPDIIIRDNEQRTCMSIDVEISGGQKCD